MHTSINAVLVMSLSILIAGCGTPAESPTVTETVTVVQEETPRSPGGDRKRQYRSMQVAWDKASSIDQENICTAWSKPNTRKTFLKDFMAGQQRELDRDVAEQFFNEKC